MTLGGFRDLMRFNMAYIEDSDTEPDRSNPTDLRANGAFIGAFVRREVKRQLQLEAKEAPGGPRTLSWVLNRILDNYINEKDNHGNTPQHRRRS